MLEPSVSKRRVRDQLGRHGVLLEIGTAGATDPVVLDRGLVQFEGGPRLSVPLVDLEVAGRRVDRGDRLQGGTDGAAELLRRALACIEVGSVWEWEPLKPHANERVRVTGFEFRGDEWQVQSVPTGGGRQLWHTLSRWVEATVLVEPPAPAVSEPSSSTCELCGALVGDPDTHAAWHEEVAGRG